MKVYFLIFFAALVVRIFFTMLGSHLTGPGHSIGDSDAAGYNLIANNVLQSGTFSLSPQEPLEPTQFRQPLYPLFLAGFYRLGFTFQSVPFVQHLIAALTAIGIYIVGLRIFLLSRRYSLIAALLFALEPYIAYLSARLMPETLLIPLVLGATAFTVILCGRHRQIPHARLWLYAMACGVLWGLAANVRASFLYLAPPLALVILLNLTKRVGVKKSVLTTLLFVIFWGATLMPWIIRNRVQFGTWTFSDLGSFVAYHYTLAYVEADRMNISLREAIRRNLEAEAHLARAPQKEKIAFWNATVQRSVRDHPLRYAKILTIHMVPFFVSDGLPNIFALSGTDAAFKESAYAAILKGRIPNLPSAAVPALALRATMMLLWLIIFILSMRAIVMCWRQGEPYLAIAFLIIIFGTALLGAVSTGLPRYRHHIAPLLFLLAATTLQRMISRKSPAHG